MVYNHPFLIMIIVCSLSDLVDMFEDKNIIGAGFIINLPDLNGDKKLIEKGIEIHSLMEF